MAYIVNIGPDTNLERFETMDEINEWLDQYIINHLQHGENFDTEKKRFIKNNIEEE